LDFGYRSLFGLCCDGCYPTEFDSYGEIVSFLLAGPLQLGLCFFFLNLVKRKETRFKLLFEGFKPLATVLLAYAIITGLTVVGLILLIVPGIAVVLDFSMTYYIIAEDPGISFQAALEQSWKFVDGL
jgi:uncharacterized membrane protein